MGGRRLIGLVPALLLYALLVPAGVLLRLVADPLGARPPRTSNWRPVRAGASSHERARELAGRPG